MTLAIAVKFKKFVEQSLLLPRLVILLRHTRNIARINVGIRWNDHFPI